jgi:hypothetical protein
MSGIRGIRLSQKHGVNPTIPLCFFCHEPKNEVVLAGRLPGDAEAPQGKIWDRRPCDQCRKLQAAGVILISVRNGEESDNPYRTGGWVVVKADAVRRFVQPPELAEEIIRKRVAFVPDEAVRAR